MTQEKPTILTCITNKRPSTLTIHLKRVFVNGYGSIGRRIATFVKRDDQVNVIGIGKNSPRGLDDAIGDGFAVYVPESRISEFDSTKISGTIESALDACDLVIDCTPGGTGYKNKQRLYEPRGLLAIYQGGETIYGDSAVSDVLFNSRSNYDLALSKSHIMQGSCNVTGIGRVLQPLCEKFGKKIIRVDILLVRRWADIEQDGIDVPDTIELSSSSHHGEDVRAYMGDDIPIYVRTLKVPTRQMHVHVFDVRFEGKAPSSDEIHDALRSEPGVAILWGVRGTHEIRKFAQSNDALADTSLVHIHAELTASRGDSVQIIYSDDQTGIVIPENHMLMQAMLFSRPYGEALARTQSLFDLENRKTALETHFSRAHT